MTERDIPKESAFDQLQTLLSNHAPELAEKINSLVNQIVLQRIEPHPDQEAAETVTQAEPTSTNIVGASAPSADEVAEIAAIETKAKGGSK